MLRGALPRGQYCVIIGFGRVPVLMYKSQRNRSRKIQNVSVFFRLGIFCRLFSSENQIVSIITRRWGVMFDLGSTVIPVKLGARELPYLQQNIRNVFDGNAMRFGELARR